VKFESTYLSTEHRYSLGIETESGTHFASIPVSNQMVDYVEAYKLTDNEYNSFRDDVSAAVTFVESCRRHEQDDRLFLQPGTDRGVPTYPSANNSSNTRRNSRGLTGVNAGLGLVPGTSRVTSVDLIGR